jgi:hypothetical protein
MAGNLKPIPHKCTLSLLNKGIKKGKIEASQRIIIEILQILFTAIQ